MGLGADQQQQAPIVDRSYFFFLFFFSRLVCSSSKTVLVADQSDFRFCCLLVVFGTKLLWWLIARFSALLLQLCSKINSLQTLETLRLLIGRKALWSDIQAAWLVDRSIVFSVYFSLDWLGNEQPWWKTTSRPRWRAWFRGWITEASTPPCGSCTSRCTGRTALKIFAGEGAIVLTWLFLFIVVDMVISLHDFAMFFVFRMAVLTRLFFFVVNLTLFFFGRDTFFS